MTKEQLLSLPFKKCGHFRGGGETSTFMNLLDDCPSAKFEEIVDLYRWIIKE